MRFVKRIHEKCYNGRVLCLKWRLKESHSRKLDFECFEFFILDYSTVNVTVACSSRRHDQGSSWYAIVGFATRKPLVTVACPNLELLSRHPCLEVTVNVELTLAAHTSDGLVLISVLCWKTSWRTPALTLDVDRWRRLFDTVPCYQRYV